MGGMVFMILEHFSIRFTNHIKKTDNNQNHYNNQTQKNGPNIKRLPKLHNNNPNKLNNKPKLAFLILLKPVIIIPINPNKYTILSEY